MAGRSGDGPGPLVSDHDDAAERRGAGAVRAGSERSARPDPRSLERLELAPAHQCELVTTELSPDLRGAGRPGLLRRAETAIPLAQRQRHRKLVARTELEVRR